LVASVIANVHRSRGTRAFSHADFMLTDRPAADQAKVANIVSFFRRAAKPKDQKP